MIQLLCDPILWNPRSVTNCLYFVLLSQSLLAQTGAFFAGTIPFIFLAPTEIGDKSMSHTHNFYQLHSKDPLQSKLSHFFCVRDRLKNFSPQILIPSCFTFLSLSLSFHISL